MYYAPCTQCTWCDAAAEHMRAECIGWHRMTKTEWINYTNSMERKYVTNDYNNNIHIARDERALGKHVTAM